VLGDEPVRNWEAEKKISLLPGQCAGCGTGMLRKNLAVHEATCQDVVVECPFPGCSVRVARRDLASHMSAAGEAHAELAQATYKRLQAAERALTALGLPVDIFLYTARDLAAGNLAGRALATGSLELTIMTPLAEQDEFLEFFAANGLELAQCTVSVDTSKSPFELGVDTLSEIFVGAETLPVELQHMEDREEGGVGEAVSRYLESLQQPQINLKVVTPDGSEIFFKCRENTQMRKLIDAFCNRNGLRSSEVRFLFDGERIAPHQTPADLGMEDGDVIDAVHP